LTLAVASTLWAQEALPDAGRLLNAQWNGGDWRTLQYVFDSSGVSLTVAIEKPDKLRAELKTGKRLLTVVSDGASTWIENSEEKRYSRLRGARQPAAWLARLDELLVRQRDFGEKDPVFVADLWMNPTTVRSERVKVDGEQHDCWVVRSIPRDVNPNMRVVWIDKKLMIPLRFSRINGIGPGGIGIPFEEVVLPPRVRLLRVDEPIPDSTFQFVPRAGSQELAAPSRLLSMSPLPADTPAPRTLLDSGWTGDWQTIQYVKESRTALLSTPVSSRVIRTTVAIAKPDRIRVEMDTVAGVEAGRMLSVVSDGDLTWIVNSRSKEYARLLNARQPTTRDETPRLRRPEDRSLRFSHAVLLSNLEELVIRQLLTVNFRVKGMADLFADLVTSEPNLRGNLILQRSLATLRSETIEVEGKEHDCWVVIGSAGALGPYWNTRLVWIDKDLWIPLQLGALSEVLWNPSSNGPPAFRDPEVLGVDGEDPEYFGGRVVSLRIDEPIPDERFTFTPPKGFKEVVPTSAEPGKPPTSR
jgi:outer membrane lipoprotein-sorting protein